MKPPVQLQFDYGALDMDTRRFVLERAERIHNLARMTATGIVQIGQYLAEVKERLGHGRFLEWIGREFGWTDRSARNFMMVYGRFKTENFSDLAIDVSALYLIAAPSTPEPARTEVIRRAGNGEAVSHQGARALVERFRETGEIPDVRVSLPQMIEERRREAAPSAPAPPAARMTAEERREQERLRTEREATNARVAAMMTVIEAIEAIARTGYTMTEVAREIERFDTPDQDWHGAVRESLARLRQLSKELKL
jgi:hypothetical protein